MSERDYKSISPKAENLVKGIFLILFSIVLAINVGPVARTFAFPFIYFLGIGCYIIYGIMLFCGLYRVFSGHKFKFSHTHNLLAFILLLISAMFFIGFAWGVINNFNFSGDGGFNLYLSNLNSSLSTYYSSSNKFINMFEVGAPYSNGLIFMGLVAFIPNNFASLGFGILFAVLSLFVELPFLIKNRKNHTTKKEVKEATKKAESYVEEEKNVLPERESEPIPEVEVSFGFEPESNSFDESDNGFEQVNMSLDDTYGGSKEIKESNNEFTRISFSPSTPEPQQTATSNNDVSNNFEEVPNEEIIDSEAPNFEDSYLDESVNPNVSVVDSPINEQTHINENVSLKNETPVINTPVVEVKKTKERVKWVAPSNELLNVYETAEATELNTKVANERVELINQVLSDFKVGAKVISYTIGSSVTRFNIQYESNVSIKVVEKLIDDISLRLGGVSARFTPLVQGEIFSGLEVPNATITTVGFKEVFDQLPDVKKHPLAVAFGKNISGDVVSADFDEFPHLLVAGTTGSGKSIYIHSIIATLIMRVSPDDLKIVLVDPKKVEMTKYRDMPHLLCPIITEAPKAKVMLDKLVQEMNDRYDRFANAENSSNIKQFNEWAMENNEETMPYIIVVLDEYADLVDTCKEISQPVVSIAQKARAAGIHLLISTQRPSTNVITGVIKGNLPTHVALMTSSYTDSMTILGEGGAEKLLGKGDMLVQSPLVSRVGLTRLQGCFIQNKEIGHIVGYLKEHYETNYDENYMDLVDHSKEVGQQMVASGAVEKEANDAEEERYQSIKEWVMCQEFVSMSKIQRECAVGFNRAGRFFTRLQKEGIVSTVQDGTTKGCQVLVHDKFSNCGGDVGSDELID